MKLNRLRIPLLLALRPDLTKFLDKHLNFKGPTSIAHGSYMPKKGEEIVELSDLPKEEFMEFVLQGIKSVQDLIPKKDG